jgi:hypothetical protein
MCRQACELNWIYGWSATTSRYVNSATGSSAFLHGCLKTDRGYDEDTAGRTTNKIHKLLHDGGQMA